jgi:hypothetical protein
LRSLWLHKTGLDLLLVSTYSCEKHTALTVVLHTTSAAQIFRPVLASFIVSKHQRYDPKRLCAQHVGIGYAEKPSNAASRPALRSLFSLPLLIL